MMSEVVMVLGVMDDFLVVVTSLHFDLFKGCDMKLTPTHSNRNVAGVLPSILHL
jgi:hypothetical protein